MSKHLNFNIISLHYMNNKDIIVNFIIKHLNLNIVNFH